MDESADVDILRARQAAQMLLNHFWIGLGVGLGADQGVRKSDSSHAPCVAVSGCLLDSPCRYDGRAKPNAAVMRFVDEVRARGGRVRRICPESAGRLTRPRPPAEMQTDGRIRNAEGRDVTEAFEQGSILTLGAVRRMQADLVILKAKSPSCGLYEIFDGTFSGRLVPGSGTAARLLAQDGFPLVDELDVESFFASACVAGKSTEGAD